MAEPEPDARTVVKAFLEAMWSGDKAAAKAAFSEDAQWWFLPSLGYQRPMPAGDALDIVMDDMIGRFDTDKPFTVDLHHLIADGGEAAAEYTARAILKTGRPYENRYLLRASVAGDRIVSVRPYTDTKFFLEELYGE
ncbi:nuclear transport factor 2 family protein [Eilatimonas milleporae]|uniref:Ketosteroid isomerase-like protein n=1 Tax=Eilatimonas milleporae TaxID=911205 RepID=A0A3M0CGH1_9PROT|nr:nuclear transport factor 2 family protein [Eilatimonas milleporae]RMB07917.1 ketosteroid isomerase-like protein [Eilatimonas milleporae]